MSEKLFVGRSKGDAAGVWVVKGHTRRALQPRQGSPGDAPSAFAWGVGGQGAENLALAILANVTDSNALALQLHRFFAKEVIANLPLRGFRMSASQVWDWVLWQTNPGYSFVHQIARNLMAGRGN